GHVRTDPDSVDGDSLGAAGPQRVDYQLQVPIEDDLLAAADSLLGDVGQGRADGGLGHGDAQTRTGDGGARGSQAEPVEGGEQSLARGGFGQRVPLNVVTLCGKRIAMLGELAGR